MCPNKNSVIKIRKKKRNAIKRTSVAGTISKICLIIQTHKKRATTITFLNLLQNFPQTF